MKQPSIGIVTVLYNSESVLEDFFRTLNEQTYKNFVLYVIDNKSTDNSLAMARSLSEKVFFKTVFFAESENWGVAKGNNIGIVRALADGCDYILLANNDIVLAPDAVCTLLDGLLVHRADMAVPKIYYWNSDRRIWCVGGKFKRYRFSTVHIGADETDDGQYDVDAMVEYAPTCFMLIQREVFEQVGMMDERYFVYYDDTDFIYRATRLYGKKLFYIAKSAIEHKVSSCTQGKSSLFTLRYGSRNHIYFALKYADPMRKTIFIIGTLVHFLVIMPFRYSLPERKVIWKSYLEGVGLYRAS